MSALHSLIALGISSFHRFPVLVAMWPLLLALSLLPTGSISQTCDDEIRFDIETQSDIDNLAQNCEIVGSNVDIDEEFTGPLCLPNITHLNWQLVAHRDDRNNPLSPPYITAFEMPDLEYAHDIALTWLPVLGKWSVPRLLTAGHIQLEIQAHLSSLEFPALTVAEKIIIVGNVSEVAFDELRAINGGIYIGNVDSVIVDFAGTAETAMDISLPLLETISGITIKCRASSISLSELVSIRRSGDPKESPRPTSRFDLNGSSISLDLPKLIVVDQSIYFVGNISALSLPSLQNITGGLWINSSSPLSIDLPLENVDEVYVNGYIKSIDLPNLRNWSTLSISSELRLDCDGFIARLNETFLGDMPGWVRWSSLQTNDHTNNTNNDIDADTEADTDAARMLFARGAGALLFASAVLAGVGGSFF
ncbi:hypothetical protein BJX62DRAFT_241571 [Aspergillus germanicus]